jgi:hypothetical protein
MPADDRRDPGVERAQLALAAELIEQQVVELLPHPGALPVPQPPPAGHRAAAAKLRDRRQLPGMPRILPMSRANRKNRPKVGNTL